MPTQGQIDAVIDIIVNSFEGDPAKFSSAMTKLKLQQEYAEIESQIRHVRQTYNEVTADFNAGLETLEAQLAAKKQEIDDLINGTGA